MVAIPQEITQEVLTGSGLYQGRSSLGGAYTSKQFVVGVPVQDGDQTIGVVLAVMNARLRHGDGGGPSSACSS